MSNTGVIAVGVRTPIIRNGDDLVNIVIDSVFKVCEENGFNIQDKDIIGITESVLAISQGNYVTADDIVDDIREKFPQGDIGVLFPITSRNRFSEMLMAIAKGTKGTTYVQLSFPSDEFGNPLVSKDKIYDIECSGLNREYNVKEFKDEYGEYKHHFTRIEYLDYYESLAPNIKVILSNNPKTILKYTNNVLISSVHRRELDRKILMTEENVNIYGLTDVLNKPSTLHGYNQEYGLLGANLSKDGVVKLFPRDGQVVVEEIQERIYQLTKKLVEVMIYGDGAFKDPVCGIWELVDPVVSPFYTSGLVGTPNELKLKYLMDSTGLSDEEIIKMIKDNAKRTDGLGTTPRQYSDLLGSLCDLISGSGDRCTPVVLVKNYFNNISDN